MLGTGNLLRSDDGVGLEVARRLKGLEKWPDSVLIEEIGTAVLNYLNEISRAYGVIIIDAIRAGGEPGSIYRFDRWDKGKVLSWSSDSHVLLPTGVIEWAQALTGFPQEVILVGIEPENLDFGCQLSLPVRAALPAAVSTVRREINRFIAG